MTRAIVVKRAGAPVVLAAGSQLLSSMTAQATRAATLAQAAATSALALTNFRSTLADGIADFAVGEYFSSAETGELRLYERIVGSPFYLDMGDAAAPLTAPNNYAKADSATAFRVLDAAGGNVMGVDTLDGFTGYAGVMTKGAGRLKLGTNASSGDDSAILITREVEGDTHSHGLRDESTVNGTVVGNAYAGVDMVFRVTGEAGSPNMDHIRGGQFRAIYDRDGDLDLFNGVGSDPTVERGHIVNLHDYAVYNGTIEGAATVDNRIGLFMPVLTGATSNTSIFVQNPAYILSDLTLDGSLLGADGINHASQAVLTAIHATGGNAEYFAGPAVGIYSTTTGAGLPGIEGYLNGAGAVNGLTINARGGYVLMGTGTPNVGGLEVNWTIAPHTDNTFDIGTATYRWGNGFIRQLRPGAGTAIWTSGTGTPEGAVTAPVGSLFTRTDGGAATTLYVKESGSGNTGWVAK